jgi:hypothetical protein
MAAMASMYNPAEMLAKVVRRINDARDMRDKDVRDMLDKDVPTGGPRLYGKELNIDVATSAI